MPAVSVARRRSVVRSVSAAGRCAGSRLRHASISAQTRGGIPAGGSAAARVWPNQDRGVAAVLVERRSAGEQFVQDDAQRVDVGGRRRLGPLDDLRRHVVRRPEDGPGRGHARAVEQAGDAEVGEAGPDPAVEGGREQDVVRLEVPVHDAAWRARRPARRRPGRAGRLPSPAAGCRVGGGVPAGVPPVTRSSTRASRPSAVVSMSCTATRFCAATGAGCRAPGGSGRPPSGCWLSSCRILIGVFAPGSRGPAPPHGTGGAAAQLLDQLVRLRETTVPSGVSTIGFRGIIRGRHRGNVSTAGEIKPQFAELPPEPGTRRSVTGGAFWTLPIALRGSSSTR